MSAKDGRPLRVHYVTMLFPAPSEVFASNDIRALYRVGVDVAVHCLRPASRSTAGLLRQRGLSSLEVTHGGIGSVFSGVMGAATIPWSTLNLIKWIVASNIRRPVHLLKSLLLAPRAVQIFRSIKKARPDVVHLFWGHYPCLVGYLVQREMPRVVLSAFLGAYDLEMNYGGAASLLQHADVVWTHANVNLDPIRRLGVPAHTIVVAHRGVDFASIRTNMGTTRRIVRRIVTGGRLVRSKRMDEVLEVFARVHAKWRDSTLVVLGDGPERRRLHDLALKLSVADSVDFCGHVSHTRLINELAQAEAFVLMSASESERLPNIVKEAMACGCVCVTTRSKGIGELLTDGVHGFVVAPGDADAAAERLLEVFAGSFDTTGITSSATDRIRERFDLERTMDLHKRRWRELVELKN